MSAAIFTRGMASPTTLQSFKNAPRSILKRPAPLPLSPNPMPFAASFSIIVSPSKGSPALASPHVHFPSTAGLVSLFSTHSPTTYDRAAIAVSPNPLALPAWGERVYSPSTGNFRKETLLDGPAQASPLLTKPVVSATASQVVVMAPPKDKAEKAKRRARARFEENLTTSKVLPREDLGQSITQFPRSPYPSAPVSPMPVMLKEEPTEPTNPRRAQRASSVSTPTTRFRRAHRPAALGIEGTELSLAKNASPHRPSFLSPVAETTTTPLDSSRLSQDFWRSVSVSEEVAMDMEAGTPTSAVPRFLFGTKDGGLWSPGLPRKADSMLSPLSRTTFGPMTQGAVLSPMPKDPYPSFGMVLAGAADAIQYPAPVVTTSV